MSFYLRQAVASLGRNRQRTLFVLFCIAVGVAAIVSLRSVGLMISESLTADLRSANRGDITASVPFADARLGEQSFDETLVEPGDDLSGARFSAAGIERLYGWAAERGHRSSLAIRSGRPASVYPEADAERRPETVISYFVEPGSYPLYGDTEIVQPPGTTLAAALAGPRAVAINERLARTFDLAPGDRLRIRGPQPFTVTAIVADGAEARLWEMEAVLIPYLLLPLETADELGLAADTAYFALASGADLAAEVKSLEQAFAGIRLQTTDDLRRQNQELSERLVRLATLMGLVSLLIGGIGIINTMLVVVGRRTLEIGVLKTIGLQGRQITVMFLVEALLLGLLGSAAGVALGVGLVAALEGIAERVMVSSLRFALYPEAWLTGLALGVLVTLVFGFLPTLSAGRVRPNVVLQPQQVAIPTAGAGVSLVVVALLTGVVGLLVGRIVDHLLVGLGIAYAAMAALGLVTLLFRGLVWLLGKLPAFGSVRFQLVQRGICSYPGRAASTLLALVVGMFALSSILLVTGSILNLIDDVLAQRLGGDIIAIARSPQAVERLEETIAGLPGLEGVEHQILYRAELVAIDGDRDLAAIREAAYAAAADEAADGRSARRDAKSDEEAETERRGEQQHAERPVAGEDASPARETAPEAVPLDEASADEADSGATRAARRSRFVLESFLGKLSIARASEVKKEPNDRIESGREVEAAGPGEIVLRSSDAVRWLGLEVGQRLTVAYDGGAEETLTIVGIVGRRRERRFQINVTQTAAALASDDAIPSGTAADPTPFIVDLADDQIAGALKRLSALDGVFALPVTLLNQLLTGLFEKLTALPLVVAVLSLFAAGVIIANSVSLAVLERRRQIGMLKALGLGSAQVLGMLLLENGLLGLAGGLIGTGIGAAGIVWFGVLSESPGSFPYPTLLALIGLAVAIALAAALLTAWGASREKPMIVLRYE